MPKGFIRLTGVNTRDGAVRLNVTHIVSFVAVRNGSKTLVTMVSKDEDENDAYHVDETPDEICALIDQAQGEGRTRSEFANAMGGAITAFGAAR